MNRYTRYLSLLAIVIAIPITFSYILESIYPYSYSAIDPPNRFSRPSREHILGTDELGRDVLIRVVRGLRNTLLVSSISTILALSISFLATVISVDRYLLRMAIDPFFQMLYAFPTAVLSMILVIIYGPGPHVIIVAQMLTLLPMFYRNLRTCAMDIVVKPYIEMVKVLGVGTLYIGFRYIAPALFNEMVTLFTYGLADAIMIEASLSFLGLGYSPPEPSLGTMIYSGIQNVLHVPQILLVSSAIVTILIVLLNTLGDSVQNREI